MKKMNVLLMLFLIFSLGINSCKKDHGTAPQIPPQSAFLADFSDFSSDKILMDTTSVNWNHSVGNVVIWNIIVTVGLAIPVASYIEAVNNHEPVYQSDNTWLWEYSFGSADSYQAKLYGSVVTDSVNWEMYISKTNEFQDFLWYSGSSGLNGMGGHWILYNKPSVPSELLKIDWYRETENTGHIRYMNIEPGGTENGGYLLYGNDAGVDADFECYYDIYNKGADNLIEIEWTDTDMTGRVKDFAKFGDTNWHCWDILKKDIVCVE
jgi:hypothetical protein